jgi:3-methyladenine DNA glycosylase AlkD
MELYHPLQPWLVMYHPVPARRIAAMELQAVMDALRSKGKPNTAKIYRRHGVAEECLGVSHGDLDALAKTLKGEHALALALWDTGVHDARVLAAKVVDPARMTREDIERWMKDTRNYVINDGVSSVAARMPMATALARDWIESADEWKSAAGWTVMTRMVMDGRIEEDEAGRLIDRIRARIHEAKNRTRYSMNNTLIAIGGTVAALREAALEAARAIGPVEVDHGETGCKTPDAVHYIERLVEHAASRKRSTRARAKAEDAGAPNEPAAKKAAAKKAAAKKPAAKKAPAKQPATKKAVARKAASGTTAGSSASAARRPRQAGATAARTRSRRT